MSDTPSFSSEAFNPDRLIAGDYPIVTADGTLLSGEDTVRGAVLGRVTLGAPTVDPDGGNTGDGVLTMAGTPLGANAQVGDYIVTITAEDADAGSFRVVAPDGSVVGDGTVAVAFTSTHINFTISDGANDWDIGDFITVTVAAGSGKYKLAAAAATDGSAAPVAILARDTDASEGDVSNVPVYTAGEFNEDRLTFGAGHDADSVRDALRDLNIYLKSPQAAVDAS